ncbi:hypothetical protein ISN44_As13g017320 [Arabidopsis suecica]|uniref:KIB1-4 beta-propeller domain-containing protein n=1 Tax=Arabidopsis suecica TaxID=45249 RepID=A0A8T1XZB8_ARASU|nr:hypothetical protein ISN44_As13g017320 [Arabidopsis suecica]
MKTVLLLSSSWDLYSAFADPLRVTPNGPTSEFKTPVSSTHVSCFPRKVRCFAYLGSGGHLIGSWDLHTQKHTPMLQKLLFQNLPGLKKTKREILDSCFTSEHLVESQSTGETFLVKLYKKTEINYAGVAKMETEAFTVFKLDEEGNTVYTKDIGDLCIFLSNSEPFSVSASSFPGMESNYVYIFDFNERAYFHLPGSRSGRHFSTFSAPYHIPPQIINK